MKIRKVSMNATNFSSGLQYFLFSVLILSVDKKEDITLITWSSEAGKNGHSLPGNNKKSGPSLHGKTFFLFFWGN